MNNYDHCGSFLRIGDILPTLWSIGFASSIGFSMVYGLLIITSILREVNRHRYKEHSTATAKDGMEHMCKTHYTRGIAQSP